MTHSGALLCAQDAQLWRVSVREAAGGEAVYARAAQPQLAAGFATMSGLAARDDDDGLFGAASLTSGEHLVFRTLPERPGEHQCARSRAVHVLRARAAVGARRVRACRQVAALPQRPNGLALHEASGRLVATAEGSPLVSNVRRRATPVLAPACTV